MQRTFRACVGAGVVLACLGFVARVQADTEVPAGNYLATTWTEAGSPYLVTGDVSFDGLTIDAGTEVLVSSGRKISASALHVNGTANQLVTFAQDPASPNGSWVGLEVSGSGNLSFAHLADAETALRWTPPSGQTLTVSGCFFDSPSTAGIHMRGQADLTVDRSRFVGAGLGIYALEGTVSVRNSLFFDSPGEAILCVGDSSCGITSSTFDGNFVGARANADMKMKIESSIFTNNVTATDQIGLGETEVGHSAFWQNTADMPNTVTDVGGNLFVDPLYVADDDYRLTPESPCIDTAADDGPTHDFDGRPRPVVVTNGAGQGFDMGAFEYQLEENGGTGGDGVGGDGAGSVSGGAGEGPSGSGGVGGNDAMGGTESSGGSSVDGIGGATGGAGGAASGSGGSTTGATGGDAGTGGSMAEESAQVSKGCGCRQPGAPNAHAAWLVVLVGIVGVRARRRARREVVEHCSNG